MDLAGLAIEVRDDVRVRVDPARHYGQAPQVVCCFEGIRVDPDDLRTLDDEPNIAEDATFSVKDVGRPNHNAACLALRSSRHRKKQRDDEYSNSIDRLLLTPASVPRIALDSPERPTSRCRGS